MLRDDISIRVRWRSYFAHDGRVKKKSDMGSMTKIRPNNIVFIIHIFSPHLMDRQVNIVAMQMRN